MTAALVSASAERKRRSRALRKHGAVLVRFEVGADAIEQLVAQGWLDEANRLDPEWVASALIILVAEALRLPPKHSRSS